MKTKVFWGLFLLIALAGCSQPLKTLMAVGQEQAGQQAYVREKEARFEALWRDVQRARLLPGLRQEKVLARYGEPVLRKGRTFLYRNPVEFTGAKKVYLEFDEQDILQSIKAVSDESQ